MIRIGIGAAFAAAAIGSPALAQTIDEHENPDQIRLIPMFDGRVRFESVDQGTLDANALTLRLRAGAEMRFGRLSLLAEGEGVIAPVDQYNAFAFPLPGESQRRPQYAVVADPGNVELNRLQLQYRSRQATITMGRQRINLDDQRWVGSVGWRQNDQTFDGLRGEAQQGPIGIDVTYAVSQRTAFGKDAGPRTAFDGNFLFAGLSSRVGRIQGKLFAYLLDYDEAFVLSNSSQTYGAILSAAIPVEPKTRLSIRASYARQSDYAANPLDYAADYWALEGRIARAGFTIAAGWEQLGSDKGQAVQTPMATLHKFNGWADLFLTTPPAGLEDAYFSIGRDLGAAGPLRDINVQLAFHQFDGAAGDVEYGTEWNASIGFGLGPVDILFKYADYKPVAFGSATRKLWLQMEWAL